MVWFGATLNPVDTWPYHGVEANNQIFLRCHVNAAGSKLNIMASF